MASSGRYLDLTADGVRWVPYLTEWEARSAGETHDASNASADGFTDTDGGVTGVVITVRAFHRISDGAFPAVRKNLILSNVVAKGNRSQTHPADFEIAEAIIVECSRPVRIRGQIEITFTLHNKGPFFQDGVLAND